MKSVVKKFIHKILLLFFCYVCKDFFMNGKRKKVRRDFESPFPKKSSSSFSSFSVFFTYSSQLDSTLIICKITAFVCVCNYLKESHVVVHSFDRQNRMKHNRKRFRKKKVNGRISVSDYRMCILNMVLMIQEF